MSPAFPLGQRESQLLELKGAEALKEPEKIAREVVAMLNAQGGVVWVGIREDNGVGVAVEPITNPELEQRRLHDFLVDTIEPALSAPEAKVVIELNERGEAVLIVELRPLERNKPYAFLRKGGRHFVIRVGDRLRPMTREELFRPREADHDELDTCLQKARQAHESAKKAQLGLWLWMGPVGDAIELDLRAIEPLLHEPERTGNRPFGWSFAILEQRAKIKGSILRSDPAEPVTVEIHRDGTMLFSAPMDVLFHKGEALEIWPPKLIELPVSALRIASAILKDHSDRTVIDFALFGLRGWQLRPGTPERWFMSTRPIVVEDDDLELPRPFVATSQELAEPDRLGWRLLERTYEELGLRREDMPALFDHRSGRLVFPDS